MRTLAVLLISAVSIFAQNPGNTGQAPPAGGLGSAAAPVPKHAPPPQYPPIARAARIQGEVVLRVTIGTDGRVSAIEVISGHPMLNSAAENAVRQWTYEPPPAPVSTTVTVPFTLRSANVLTDTAKDIGPMGATREVRWNDYRLKVGPGWQVVPPGDSRSFVLKYTGDLSGDSEAPPEIRLFEPSRPFSNEAERKSALAEFRQGLALDRGTLVEDTMKLAGVEALRLSDLAAAPARWSFTMFPFTGAKVYKVQVSGLRERDLPLETQQVLASLTLDGPPFYASGLAVAAATPAGKAGSHPVQRLIASAPRPRRSALDEVFVKPSLGDFAVDGSACALQLPPPKPRPPFTLAQYNADVTSAMEVMRVLHGPLPAAAEAKFNAKWAKLLVFATDESLAYFNKLVPLLEQFLATRKIVANATRDFDKAWAEAVSAAAVEDEPSARLALRIAASQKQFLECANTGLAAIVKRIEALGNPPDPVAARKRARETARSLSPPKAAASTAFAEIEFSGLWSGRIALGGKAGLQTYWWPWTVFILPARPGPKNTIAVEVFYTALMQPTRESFYCRRTAPGDYKCSPDADLNYRPARIRIDGVTLHWDGDPSFLSQLSTTLRRVESGPPPAPNSEGAIAAVPEFSRKGMREENAKHRSIYAATQNWTLPPGQSLFDAGFYLTCRARLLIGDETFPECREIVAKGPKDAPVQVASQFGKPEDEVQKRVQEAIAEKEALLKLIERNVARDRADLTAAADPNVRRELYLRILDGEANLQAEKDLIASLKSGQYVHTRTARDEYQRDLMISTAYETAAKVDESRKLALGADKMAALATPEQAQQVRDFIARSLTPADVARGDVEKARQVANMVSKMVQRGNEEDQTRSVERAIAADNDLYYAQCVKTGAGMVLMTMAPYAYAEIGMAAEAAANAGVASSAVFGAITGAVEGGPVEAVKQAAALTTLGGMAAAEAMSGYQEGGVEGAAKNAAVVFLLGKFMEAGASKIAGMSAARQGASVAEEKVASMTLNELKLSTEFQGSIDEGRKLIAEYRAVSSAFRNAQKPGATPESLHALEEWLLDKAAELNSSYPAKLLVKKMSGPGVTAEDALLHRDLAGSIDLVYAKRLDRPFMNAVDTGGYQWEQMTATSWKPAGKLTFREIRNVSSKGTLNIDRDLALMEKDLSQFRIVKNGQPMTMYEVQDGLQRTYEDVYRRVLKQDPKKAFQSVTTSVNQESYKQLAYTNVKDARNLDAIRRGGWSQQAADVGRIKVWHAADPSLKPVLQLVENSRAAAKEIDKRLLPMLREQKADPKQIQNWMLVQDALTLITDNPVVGSRLLKMRTGTDSIREVIDMIGTALEGSVKMTR